MFKSRKFLKGLGIGLMVGAVLTALATIGAEAGDGNLITASPSPSIVSTASTASTASPSPTPQAIKALTDVELIAEAEKRDLVVMEKKDYDALNALVEQAKEASPGEERTLVYIPGGLTFNSIEDYLYNAGVIRDRAEFQDKVRSAGLQSKMKAGLFTFHSGDTTDEVIAKLTGKTDK
ncbi:hypothetical protein [Gorillibacterium massiliense]|uniref:hypothetical protein n=1 Tax=Gorillibacterium massiliense TaxID=1280390 RepID=UPI0004B939D5|nr:hypothetical protein [Gorillibacterium massiliense]